MHHVGIYYIVTGSQISYSESEQYHVCGPDNDEVLTVSERKKEKRRTT